MNTNETIKINAKVNHIRYPKSDVTEAPDFNPNSFYIIGCDVGVVKGRLDHCPKTGELLVLDGRWQVSKYNGKPEFSFFHASVDTPTNERALLRYVCEMTSGFGHVMEQRIWDALHENWDALTLADGVSGLTLDKLHAFQKTIQFVNLNQERTKTLAWLMDMGFTLKMAEATFEKWGVSAHITIEADPYILASLPYYGFAEVDVRVRKHFPIDRNAPRRIDAALKYCLKVLSSEDTAISWEDLYTKTITVIDSDPQSIADRCRAMFESGEFASFPRTMRITSCRDFRNESTIFMFARNAPAEPVIHGKIKARQPKPRDFDLDADQLAAVQFALNRRFSIINGSAGTGKTSLVHAICDSLKGHSEVRLCAFAGKAAARLREATMHEASTIHRMLGWQGDNRGFSLKSLAGSSVILDEASMVSSDLLAEIVKRNPDRLVLVGDEAQLPPVGSGQPFHDLVKLLPDSVRTLGTCYRSREAVLSSALAIRSGLVPPASAQSDTERYEFRPCSDAAKTHELILDAVRSGEIDFSQDLVLCCRNGETPNEPCSVRAFNNDIKAIVNPRAEENGAISPGDRVICTVNSSELDVWNGTTGRCSCFDAARAMWVELDFPNANGETSVLIPKDKVKDWQLAYALTVHKSQGSQYRKVFFVILRRDIAMLLSRPMIYTAVTRAKNECRIIGDVWAFSRAVSEVRPKHTVMQELAIEQGDAK